MTREKRYEWIRWNQNVRMSKHGNKIVLKCFNISDFVRRDIQCFMAYYQKGT